MILKTPRLIELSPDYVKSISKRARYERKQALAAGRDCEYVPVTPGVGDLREAMEAWSKQIGKPWGKYSAARFLAEEWSFFRSDVALHPVLICDDYAYAAAPMYDKTAHPWAAKYMWFRLIDWLVADGAVKWLDLGGGSQKTWRGLLESPDKTYKWLYIPRAVRRNPVLAPQWKVQCCKCGWRQLVEQARPCRGCAS